MEKEEEREYWRKIIQELQAVMTIAQIAEAVMVEPRQVWRWKEGDRPTGMTAIRVYQLHAKTCPVGHCPVGHIAN